MSKKILAFLLAAVMLLLCGCGGNGEEESSAPDATETTDVQDTTAVPETTEDDGKLTYTVTVLDENNEPISDVMVQLCKDSNCIPGMTDAAGVAQFQLAEDDYHGSVMTMPDGYDYAVQPDENGYFYFEDGSVDMVIYLTSGTEQTTEPTETTPVETEPADETTPEETTEVVSSANYTAVSETVYATGTVNVRSAPDTSSTKLGKLSKGDSVVRTAIGDDGWSLIEYNGQDAYVYSSYLSTTNPNATTVGGNDSSSSTGGNNGSTGGNNTTTGGNNSSTGGNSSTSSTTATTSSATDPIVSVSTDPISCYPDSGNDSDFYVTLTELAPNASQVYDIYRVGGMQITIEDANAYVIYNGTKYTASNGKVQFTAEDVTADKAIQIEVGNTGSASKTFSLRCQALKGTYENPVTLSTLNGSQYSLRIAKNEEEGYYYSYTAEKSGTITFKIVSASNSANVGFRITRMSDCYQCDFESEVTFTVEAGDVLEILLCTQPNSKWERPATDVVWTASY